MASISWSPIASLIGRMLVPISVTSSLLNWHRTVLVRQQISCPALATAVLRAYLAADTAGARHSSEAWKASGIDTLTWDPHH